MTFGRAAPADGREAPADAVAEGAASPVIPPAVGLPSREPLVGNWPRVKYLLEGWGLPQNWGTRRAAELSGKKKGIDISVSVLDYESHTDRI